MSTDSPHSDNTIDGTPTFEKHDFPTLEDTPVTFKFELLKASGAFSNLLALTDNERAASVTCVSAGNHAVAVAVAYAAHRMNVGARKW